MKLRGIQKCECSRPAVDYMNGPRCARCRAIEHAIANQNRATDHIRLASVEFNKPLPQSRLLRRENPNGFFKDEPVGWGSLAILEARIAALPVIPPYPDEVEVS